MVRERNGVFACNYNMCDFDFASAFDAIAEFRNELEKKLNG